MILQALARYYEDLLALGVIARPGWAQVKVSYGLELADDGSLIGLLPLQTEQQRGKKAVLLPRLMEAPMPVKRSSGVAANFLCDNSGYLLGADDKGKPSRTAACFAACKTLHLDLLADAQSPAARAVAAFFERWDPAQAASHPALAEKWEALMNGDNLVFWYRDAPVTSDSEICRVWQEHTEQTDDACTGRCLVTGSRTVLSRLHPNIKGVTGAQSSGAALVSFNAEAFNSYGHEQGLNAPVGAYAAFAYTTALNYLLADRERVRYIGDTTVVCWAVGGQSAYQDFGMAALYGDTATEQDIQAALGKLTRGEPAEWSDAVLDPATHFYVLGLAPNAARLAVRFFWQDSFGAFADNVQRHYERLQIARPSYDKFETLPVWRLLRETVNKNSRDSKPVPQLAGDVLRAILTNSPYPATLLNGVMLRIRAEHEVTRGRAAIIKAYYLQNKNEKCPEEVLTMELNEDSNYQPYVLGRLFAVLEELQTVANPNLNATIKDKYFNAAASTPAVIIPLLLDLAQNHLHKLEPGKKNNYDRRIHKLLQKITETYPAQMSLPEKGAFQIGYYHQKTL